MDALLRVGDGAGRQVQFGAHLPVGGGAPHQKADGGLPAGDLHLVAVSVGQLLAGDALERGLGRGALAEGQQGAEGPGGVDAELTARHAQAAFLHGDETGLFRPQVVGAHGLPGQLRLPGRIQARGGEKERGVAPGAPFGKIECWHNPSFCIYSVCYRRARLSSYRASPAGTGGCGAPAALPEGVARGAFGRKNACPLLRKALPCKGVNTLSSERKGTWRILPGMLQAKQQLFWEAS